MAGANLRDAAQHPGTLLLFLRPHAVSECVGHGAGARRVGEAVDAADLAALDQIEGVLKCRLVLVGKADDHVRGHVDVWDRGAQRTDRLEVLGGRVVAAHCAQDAIVARLHGYVQVGANLRLGTQRLDQRVLDVDHLDGGEPHPLDPRHACGTDHQLPKLEPVLRVPIVADADTGHHHLRLAQSHALLDLLEHGR
jgi:hypothetical protein